MAESPSDFNARVTAALARGDARGFDALYAAYKDRLVTVAYHVLGDRQAAFDVLHDVFLSLVRNPRSVLRAKDLTSYLLRMALNRARDLLRRRHLDAKQTHARPPAPAADPAAVAAADDQAALLSRLLARLPQSQREVVVLHVFEDLTLPEVANIVGAPVNTVQSRFRYALDALRRQLARKGTA